MINYKIKVKGNVQGVGYRYATYQKARLLGVKGTVENLEDGSVEIWANAEEDQMNQFINWCKIGPDAARVEWVDAQSIDPMNAMDFQIVRK